MLVIHNTSNHQNLRATDHTTIYSSIYTVLSQLLTILLGACIFMRHITHKQHTT